MLRSISRKYRETALIKLIAVGLIIGILIALYAPAAIPLVAVLGDVFVRALKGVAPILVFVLVMNAMAQRTVGSGSALKPIVRLYVIATFLASIVAVAFSFAFPSSLHLVVAEASVTPPSGIVEVIHNDFAVVMTQIVLWVIRFAPFGIMGLVADAVGTNGTDAIISYLHLLAVLLGAFFSVALIMNPIIVWLHIRRNPFPLVIATLRESGIYAFFTRSSAANIPVNMQLCKRLGLNPDVYSISIPLGATINMSGAAITIAVLSLAAAHTLNITVDLPTALLLCLVATVGACGASGVAGGSLLLIPVACSSFGISNDIAMQVVGVGFIIGVLQDSCETALNSSTDVLFTATAEFADRARAGTLKDEDMVPNDEIV